MSSGDASDLAAVAAGNDTQIGHVRFLGRDGIYWRILARGAIFLIITLGLYRFWLTTDIRRFLWANTEIDGDSLEYSGTAVEILLGFLAAVALLVPFYTVFFLSALDVTTASLMATIAILAIAFLGQCAVWLARKYRLSRTVFRGLRFHQTGTAIHYAICVLFWWAMMLVTLGIAYPFAQASLERLKLRNTFYGNLPGRFEGSGFSLLLRGAPLWFVVMAPTLIAVSALFSIDWQRVGAVAGKSRAPADILVHLNADVPDFFAAIGLFVVTFGFSLLATLALFPAFQTIVMRWWVSGLRFEGVAVTSRLRMRDVYRAYLRFVGYLLLFALAIACIALATFGVIDLVFGSSDQSKLAEIAIIMTLVGLYVVSALGLSTIYQATAKLSVWRLTMESSELSGVNKLHDVKAAGAAASPFGEGFADALNVGGL